MSLIWGPHYRIFALITCIENLNPNAMISTIRSMEVGRKFTTMVYEINHRDLKKRTGYDIWNKVFDSTIKTDFENILIDAHHISYEDILGIFADTLNPIIIQNWP